MDDSATNAKLKPTRTVKWLKTIGSTKSHLSEKDVVFNMAPSILSVPALTKKKIISVIFMPRGALTVDLQNSFSVLGTALRGDNGVCYILDLISTGFARMLKAERKNAFTVMTIACNHTQSYVSKPVPESETENMKKVEEHLTSTGTSLVDHIRSNSSLVFFDCTRAVE